MCHQVDFLMFIVQNSATTDKIIVISIYKLNNCSGLVLMQLSHVFVLALVFKNICAAFVDLPFFFPFVAVS